MSQREIYTSVGGRVIYYSSITARRIDITDELAKFLATPSGKAFAQLIEAGTKPLVLP